MNVHNSCRCSVWMPLPTTPPTSRRLLILLLTAAVLIVVLPGALSQSDEDLCANKDNGRYFCPDCSASAASSRGDPSFEANLLRLQAYLQGMDAANATFLNATFAGGDAAGTVHGLAMCFADAEQSNCAACLAGVAAELPATRCGGRRDMVLWHAHCLARYGNASFLGAADTSPARRFYVPNPSNFSDEARLLAARKRLAARMIPAAAASLLRFEFDDEKVTANQTLHGLAQCTEDLPGDECVRCLAAHMGWLGRCCAAMNGVRLYGPSCYLRYELMAFVPRMPPSMAPLIQPPAPGNSSSKKTRLYILAGSTSSSLVLCFLLLGAFLCYKNRHGSLQWQWRRGSSHHKPRIESLLQHHHPKRYSYSQVKRMTKSFADKLGEGGNGAVYKGVLPDDGREVAVKMLKAGSHNIDGEEFINEVASISRTSHVNVVTLLGFCVHGSSKRGLIYEFMPNGSLEKHNFSLDWENLFDIAVGIARGLEYLHRGCNAHIVHFDIKPQNILLDQDFRPKISDFGLAKLCTQKEIATIPVNVAGARGTVGYISPELFHSPHGGAVTSKSDVYSYGMMILEMVGATRRGVVVVDVERSSDYFPQWLYRNLDEFCVSACEVDAEATELVRKMVVIGLWCIQTSPSDRPSMSRVVEMLENSDADQLQLPPHASSRDRALSTNVEPDTSREIH